MNTLKNNAIGIRSLGLLLLFAWTIVVGGSLVWNIHQNNEQTDEIALREASTIFNKDQGFRLWGTRHGGVYVPISEDTPPSPYMAHIQDRDIVTPSGVELTLLNPAYMVRQMMEDFATLYGARGHITGLVLLRPENKPDSWEENVLHRLKDNPELQEVSEIGEIDGAPYIRLMRPMYMKPGCDKCHGHLGFKEGDFRGGVSVTLPMKPYIAERDNQNLVLTMSHGVIWVLGSIALWAGGGRISTSFEQTRKAEAEVRALNRDLESRVTERTRELSEQSTRLHTTIDNAADGIIVIDQDGLIDTFNTAAGRIFGYEPDECIGKPVTMLMPEPHAKAHHGYIDNHLKTGKTHIIGKGREVEGVRKDGTVFPIYLAVSRLDLGDRVLFSGICRDLTVMKKTEAELIRAKADAEQANRAKSEFLASMSHELRTPLNGIIGFAQLLEFLPNEPLSKQQKTYTAMINNAGQHLLSLIDDILDLSRIETEGFSMSIETVDAQAAIENCLTLIVPVGEKHKVTFNYEYPASPVPMVFVDEVRFKQVLMNLLSNAAKYNTPGGHVELSLDISADKVRLNVTDDGPGIAADRLPELFEPFNRLGQEAGSIEGSGIGLTITRELVKRMNGSLGVETTEGVGSTFWFEVPVSHAPITDITIIDPLSVNDLHPPERDTKVLYIEDNIANSQLMEEILRPYPHIEFITTLSGEDGLEYAKAEVPDLVLMDINLPGIDGFEALNHLKNDDATKDIPVIAISANALPQDVLHGKRALFEAYLTKPINVRRTLKTIFEVLDA